MVVIVLQPGEGRRSRLGGSESHYVTTPFHFSKPFAAAPALVPTETKRVISETRQRASFSSPSSPLSPLPSSLYLLSVLASIPSPFSPLTLLCSPLYSLSVLPSFLSPFFFLSSPFSLYPLLLLSLSLLRSSSIPLCSPSIPSLFSPLSPQSRPLSLFPSPRQHNLPRATCSYFSSNPLALTDEELNARRHIPCLTGVAPVPPHPPVPGPLARRRERTERSTFTAHLRSATLRSALERGRGRPWEGERGTAGVPARRLRNARVSNAAEGGGGGTVPSRLRQRQDPSAPCTAKGYWREVFLLFVFSAEKDLSFPNFLLPFHAGTLLICNEFGCENLFISWKSCCSDSAIPTPPDALLLLPIPRHTVNETVANPTAEMTRK
ncbi:hypothetical protein C7M84_019401 [Penaeus vannamei]|uniref:Uncharacterized protein n=1 Tax=Penaeus vannamei TaxID=6689 RepID=A0A3R7PE45_PENVA|nr:hypothetical protein C7M84_019401 [Penaeus vannamei]